MIYKVTLGNGPLQAIFQYL